ncbi:putative transcriptional regulator [Peptoniphilus koenoeneniae]|uniref:Transcriptional regulator n=1 Tax=Peptoniphilus koenoeneniae TaxID=507751 RepID=A0ABU0AVK7_9FIRM|nr:MULTISPECIES: helix-turn-helix transcriptional regulator [Peptoniphilus]ERT56240.1 DNA-binding helix-turn-helix protein [Peptoniphilus sp. BV3C26]MDQ0275304.1 putative transcriptional regulator [Peptoniphilus koenoeneniae]
MNDINLKLNKHLIKKKLIELNLTQNEFANKNNIAQSTLSNVLNGRQATTKTLNKIANGLGISVVDLLED